jgi:hypothetical protein
LSIYTFDGKINGKPVKVIVINKGWKQAWFAKPKSFDVNTPHFEQEVNGKLELHEDSADGKSFRVMNVVTIYSGSLNSGITFAENKGRDMAILPMCETSDGFTINTNLSGSSVTVPSGQHYCLMAYGKYGPWQLKNMISS